METNEVIEIELDVADVEMSIKDVIDGLAEMKNMFRDLGATITKAFTLLQKSINKLGGDIYAMSDALAAATSAMQGFADQIANESGLDWFLDWFSAITSGISLIIDFVTNSEKLGQAIKTVGSAILAAFSSSGVIGKAVTAIGAAISSALTAIASALGISVGWVVAIIAAVVAAIAAVIIYWDEIKLFFTETLPQLWSQFIEWICGVGNVVAEAFSNTIAAMGQFFSDCWDQVVAALSGAAQWLDSNVLQPIACILASSIDVISGKVQEGIGFIQTVFAGINMFLQGAFAKDWTEQFGVFGNVLNGFFASVQNICDSVKMIFSGFVDFVKNVFADDWAAAWGNIAEMFKGIWESLLAVIKIPINGIIGLINGLVQGVVAGINALIRAMNRVRFDIPDWIPGLGGQSFGFHIATLSTPNIPYLAQGAVLPANRPFLAVVGDQRHGTNVEAPLKTIQDAVAVVMEDHINAMMTGFQALLDEQRMLRQTVEGIEIGDRVIGQAAQRYNRTMAMMRGGQFFN